MQTSPRVLLGGARLRPAGRVPGGGAGADPAVGGDEHALAARTAEVKLRPDGFALDAINQKMAAHELICRPQRNYATRYCHCSSPATWDRGPESPAGGAPAVSG